jgi:hypothetical protein
MHGPQTFNVRLIKIILKKFHRSHTMYIRTRLQQMQQMQQMEIINIKIS